MTTAETCLFRRHIVGRAACRTLIFGLIWCLLTGCEAARSLRDGALDAVISIVPRAVDTQIGAAVSAGSRDKSAQVPAPLQSSLGSLVNPLVRVLPEVHPQGGVVASFRVIPMAIPNAFAYPDGSIFFTTGLLRIVQTPEEVLAVAGHELAHVIERHSMQSLVAHTGLSLTLQVLLGDYGVLAGLAGLGGQFMTLQFSRDNEREADALGAEILRRAQVPLRGSALFFERMAAWERDAGRTQPGGSGPASFMSTHPGTEERLAWARALEGRHTGTVSDEQRRAFGAIQAGLKALPE